MKISIAGLLVTALAVGTGCNDANKAGGPGAVSTTSKKVTPADESTFTIDPQDITTKFKQGETKAMAMSIKRSKGFDQDVVLSFDNLPKGVTITPASPALKAGTQEAKFTITAAADAALGEFTIKVNGHPTRGADASNDFKIVVEQK